MPRKKRPAGVEPLSPHRKWRAITLATLVLVPAYWSMLAGLVAAADDGDSGPHPGAAIAGDAVTGIVAGVGAGGVVALRADGPHNARARAWAVLVAVAYTFFLVR